MTQKLTKAYVAATQRVDAVAARKDAGQGALEYIGILAVVALVIGLALGGFDAASGDIEKGVKGLIEKVFSAGNN
jgi:hypothetical protein